MDDETFQQNKTKQSGKEKLNRVGIKLLFLQDLLEADWTSTFTVSSSDSAFTGPVYVSAHGPVGSAFMDLLVVLSGTC